MRRTLIRSLLLLGFMGASGLLVSCSDATAPEGTPVVQFAEHAATVAVGDTVRLTLLPMLPPGYVPQVTWSSSNVGTATVTASGTLSARVTGVRAGQVVITATGEEVSDSVEVTVSGASD